MDVKDVLAAIQSRDLDALKAVITAQPDLAKALHPHEQEGGLRVEQDEQQGQQVEPDRRLAPGRTERDLPAFVGVVLLGSAAAHAVAQQGGGDEQPAAESNANRCVDRQADIRVRARHDLSASGPGKVRPASAGRPERSGPTGPRC